MNFAAGIDLSQKLFRGIQMYSWRSGKMTQMTPQDGDVPVTFRHGTRVEFKACCRKASRLVSVASAQRLITAKQNSFRADDGHNWRIERHADPNHADLSGIIR
jgi:hypothetical protein